MSLLDRRCQREALRLLLFYGAGFAGLTVIGVATPLVARGAPLADVIALLPTQLALPAVIALPMALVTAVLGTIGRMREEGELVALAGAGIGPVRVVRALLPLVLVCTVLEAVLAHGVLPATMRAWREGMGSLLRQAVAARVSEQKPIADQDGVQILARQADGGRLDDLVLWFQDDGGADRWVVHAPEARWINDPEADPELLVLRLGLVNARVLQIDTTQVGSVTAARLSWAVSDLAVDRPYLRDHPDAIPSRELPHIRAGLRRLRSAWLTGDPAQRQAAAWLELQDPLTEADLGALDRLRERAPTLGIAMPGDRPSALLALEGRRAEIAIRDGNGPGAALVELADLAGDGLRLGALRQLTLRYLRQPGLLAADSPPPALLADRIDRFDLAWHLRWALPATVFAAACFAAGMALHMAPRGRLMAAAIGLGAVVAGLLPGMILGKGLEGRLPLPIAGVVWPGPVLLLCFGLYLLRRGR